MLLCGASVSFEAPPVDRPDMAQRVAPGLRMLAEGSGVFADLTVALTIDVVAARRVVPGAMFGAESIDALFRVLDQRRTTGAGSLSSGQHPMPALSLAVLGTPRWLLLLEASIDRAPHLIERTFRPVDYVCKSHATTAVLVDPNDDNAMDIAERVLIMNNGQILFDGLPDEAQAPKFRHNF